MRYIISICVVVLAIGGCKLMQNMVGQLEPEKYEFTKLEQGGFYEVDKTDAFVISDVKALNSLYAKLNITRKPGIPVPIIDFNQHQILVAQSNKYDANGNIYLTLLEETEDALKIEVKTDNADNQLVPFPFCIYKMAKTSKEIQFVQD